ncbi:MAG: PEP/pyruvate-binding domain-containing protein, partial [Planctomycetota bacterium]
FRILLAAVKYIEDRLNVDFDTKLIGVQSIIVIEDNVRYYSSFLPNIYTEVMRHSQRVLSESLNQSHRILRMRARPKILLCSTYEEAWHFFTSYHENILGVISDIEFSRRGRSDPQAGVVFARNVRDTHPDIPILLQSSDVKNREHADELGVSFLHKDSPLLLQELREFLVEHMGFGDFVFRLPEGGELKRAKDLRSLEDVLGEIPDESLLFHAERNHFSRWLKARTEFWLAHSLRPRKVSEFDSVGDIRRALIGWMRDFRHSQQRGIIVDFDPESFDPESSFARIGSGSLGGKGRGLAFLSRLVEAYGIDERFPGVTISVPPAVVIGTDTFDRFLEVNDLRDFAIKSEEEEEVERRFLKARLPGHTVHALRCFADLIRYPLAVRSSSLLEDSQHQPFAGIYGTVMLPNTQGTTEERLEELVTAVKKVYASTFSRQAKAYMRATSYRLEEEKMAVVIQRLVGTPHESRFYPDFAGVARSHNYYPRPPMKSEDGIAAVALGMGAMVVEGGASLRFCPRYPRHVIQFPSVEETFLYSQRLFYALELPNSADPQGGEAVMGLSSFDLTTAEQDGVLGAVGSTYSMDNDAIYDGIARKGTRLVSFAPILKHDLFPLPQILELLLEVGRWSMSSSVEIEFAVNLSVPPGQNRQFRVLQMRPMVLDHEYEEVSTRDVPRERLICESGQVLGNGTVRGVSDIVLVDVERFERASSRAVAREIGLFNYELMKEDVPYVLFGVGRWGSADPWLGIPVKWQEISGARVIVESSFRDLRVTPSEGSHFFQNLATMRVGYFTVDSDASGGFLDWEWLLEQPSEREREFTRLVRLAKPLTIKMDGRTNHGIILKPEGYSLI